MGCRYLLLLLRNLKIMKNPGKKQSIQKSPGTCSSPYIEKLQSSNKLRGSFDESSQDPCKYESTSFLSKSVNMLKSLQKTKAETETEYLHLRISQQYSCQKHTLYLDSLYLVNVCLCISYIILISLKNGYHDNYLNLVIQGNFKMTYRTQVKNS